MLKLPELVSSIWYLVTGKKTSNQIGASLMELILVFGAVGFLILLLGNLPSSVGLIGKSRQQSIAREVAAKQIEDKRSVQFSNLAEGTQNIVDARLNILPSGAGTIVIEPCDISVCSPSEIDSMKQVTVTVSWIDGSDNRQIKLKTLIGEGGLNQ
jgi:hypothetical protein